MQNKFSEVADIKEKLEKIRKPEKKLPLKIQLIITAVIMLLGGALGVMQKWLDSTDFNELPMILQRLDIVNYFGRLAVWILLAAVISLYSTTPLRASVNTFSFFVSMLAGYYIYCHFAAGFLPVSYMMMWAAIAAASFFGAYVCWYAKGGGIPAILISAAVAGALFSQAFCITQGFYVYHVMEIFTWLAGVIVLRRKIKEFAALMGASLVFAAVIQLVMPHWG